MSRIIVVSIDVAKLLGMAALLTAAAFMIASERKAAK